MEKIKCEKKLWNSSSFHFVTLIGRFKLIFSVEFLCIVICTVFFSFFFFTYFPDDFLIHFLLLLSFVSHFLYYFQFKFNKNIQRFCIKLRLVVVVMWISFSAFWLWMSSRFVCRHERLQNKDFVDHNFGQHLVKWPSNWENH